MSTATLSFSGHETFACRQFWLKKGYDHLNAGHSLRDKDAIAYLGVGRNMLTSINFWLQAFGLMEDGELTRLSDFIFSDDDGVDPFLESPASVWLLHYHLVRTGHASIYQIVFDQIKADRVEFDEDLLSSLIERELQKAGRSASGSTIKNDIGTFRRNYVRPRKVTDLEDDLSGLLIELNLVKILETKEEGSKRRVYKIENRPRPDIPPQLILYGILLQMGQDREALNFHEILNGKLSVGRIFALNASGLMDQIEAIVAAYPDIAYTSDGGIQQLTIKDRALRENPWSVLEQYYGLS
jgi:hypothetical protein